MKVKRMATSVVGGFPFVYLEHDEELQIDDNHPMDPSVLFVDWQECRKSAIEGAKSIIRVSEEEKWDSEEDKAEFIGFFRKFSRRVRKTSGKKTRILLQIPLQGEDI
jgi:hypothetical protein